MKIGPHRLTLELAINPKSRACGLSNRQTLPDNHGMLFIFPYEKLLSFWMHNTVLALSIVFLDSEKIVIDRYEMVPFNSEIIYRSKRPGLYALEMPKNWFVSHGVVPGDKLNFSLPDALEIQ